MIEIYKKLPGINCGKCGAASCMAFAWKVKKSQANLSDCPHMAGEAVHEVKPGPATGSFSSYEQVSRELEKEAVGVDFREAAEAIGGTYESAAGGEEIRLKMLNKVYELRKGGCSITISIAEIHGQRSSSMITCAEGDAGR